MMVMAALLALNFVVLLDQARGAVDDGDVKLFSFGHGYVSQALFRRLAQQGWRLAATARTPAAADALAAQGAQAVDPDDRRRMAAALADAAAVLISAPPTEAGCPGLNSVVPALAAAGAFPDWIGYLSTTGVYGDRDGGWVFEDSPRAASSVEGARRVGAERDWLQVGRGMGLTVQSFRLPGIYGPGRSAFERLDRPGVDKPGQVFSRIHVDDLAAALELSIRRPSAGAIYNICDDEPAPPQDVTAFAARLAGRDPPPLRPFDPAALSPAALRFYAENKRVSNAKAKAVLGWRPAHPTYREGLAAVLAARSES
jgi:nucleoside-diphosphate-sugar epimerase